MILILPPSDCGVLMKTVLSKFQSLHDHPSYLCCPDVHSLVGDPLSGNGCGSPNHI